MKKRVVEAVGFAHRPGHIRINREARRLFLRIVTRILALPLVPAWMRRRLFASALHWCPVGGGSIGDTFENDLLALIFTATAITGIADNAGSTPVENLTIALHTGDPGEDGDQTDSEATYGSYARQNVARSGSGGTVSGNSWSPDAAIEFPEAASGTETITHFSIGSGQSNKLLFSGTVSPNISVTTGVTPRLTTSTAVTLD